MAADGNAGVEIPSVTTAAALKNALDEKDEELRTWRIRCMQAEAEVRALKRGTRHTTDPSTPSSPDSALRPVLDAESRLGEAPQHEVSDGQLGKMPELFLQSSAEERQGELETEELRQQLAMKNSTIIQLQADMHREQQLREKSAVEKQRKAAESQQMCREELREMTQRAESLSEQVRKSKKRGTELQAARESAREELARVRAEFLDCEAASTHSAQVAFELKSEQQSLQAELASSFEALEASEGLGGSEDKVQAAEVVGADSAPTDDEVDGSAERRALEERLAVLGQDASVAPCLEATVRSSANAIASISEGGGAIGPQGDEVAGAVVALSESAWKGRDAKVVQCLSTLQQLHGEFFSKDARAVRRPLTAKGKPGGDEVVARMALQLQKALQLLEGANSADTSGPSARSSRERRASAGRPSSPEGEHPVPEDRRNTGAVAKDSDEVLQAKLDINEVRVAVQAEKEVLIADHCDELDDLVRRHDKERRDLHREVAELRSEYARAEASEAMARPIRDIRLHFDSQVAVVKQELVVQLADIQECQRVQRGQDDQEMDQLRSILERCQKDLASSQHEFTKLAMLFDKEQGENHRLRLQQQKLVDRQEALSEVDEVSTLMLLPGEQANNVTIGSIRSSIHDITEDTTVADTLPGIAASGMQERAEGPRGLGLATEEGALVGSQVPSAVPPALPA
eukprot:CAMPEP_0115138386 /NCGR_PEP_ID=MMETSP0227-20121206/57634_1 /TAXON_ID=89957 /ORGANISM="Polarella glacialis, Strain CCMP 1383" /LENGTH=689 /DNA_ID=CAMNT_0002545993 /DNA_START=39 /DNA_END=2106 /DNA_ORIENTATION=+